MKISPIFYRFNFVEQNNTNNSIKKQQTFQNQTIPFYPKNYQPYFGERLNRTPENFFSQEFNQENMPVTVKKYFDADKENNKGKEPIELQREAFEWLPHCTTVDDVKQMYPDEPLFQNLRTYGELRHLKFGYLHELKHVKKVKSNEVLQSGEELTLYLLRKIYLEGKDLEEINTDFKKDVRQELRNEQYEETEEGNEQEHNVQDEQNELNKKFYFQYSTLKALGIKFPDISYWHSLQATRKDKEYIPSTRTFDPTKERKKRVYTPRPPRVLTKEEIEKRKERMINRWLSLSPVQQANQIAKMRAGLTEKGSIFFDYISPIMIIATEHIKLSDKLVEFFKKDSMDCPLDLSNMTKEQGKKLQKFWDENPKLKDEFSSAICKTIKIYETASKLGVQYIEKLNTIAKAIRAKNELNEMKRKRTTPEAIKAYMTESIMESIGLYYKPYAEKYLAFVLNHRLYKTNFTEAYTQNIMSNLDHVAEYEDKMNKIMNSIHHEFVTKNMRETISVNTAVAEVLYRATKNPLLFSANNTQLLLTTIAKNNLQNYVASCKDEITQKVSEYTSGLSDENLRKAYTVLTEIMQSITKNGYVTLADENVRRRAQNLPKILKKIEKDKKARNHFKDFIRQYEGQVKFALNQTTSYNIRFYMFESIIDDYLISQGL